MVYSEKEYKLLLEKLKKSEKENEEKANENRILKSENRHQKEVIQDLDRNDYRGQCNTLKIENKELKKKVLFLEGQLGIARTSLEKDSSNSCKPSSTNGFKKIIQNNRVKSGRKPR